MSWEDLEFQNITNGGSLNQQQIDKLKKEKQKFNYQLQKTLDFINTGNYSMFEQFNIDYLYQKWKKLEVKYISMVCPIKSKIEKYKTQEPYSHSIILAAKVIQDQSDLLKLFNIMNINSIKIPLIIESAIVCLAVFLFIANYGYFQLLQVQRPIEILIKFLKKSLQQQHQCQVQIYTKKDEKVVNLSNIQKMIFRKRNTTTNLTNNFSKFKNEDQVNTLLSPVHNETPSQTTFNNLQFVNQWNQLDRRLEQNKTIQLFSKVNLNSKANLEDHTQVEYLDSCILKNKKQRHYSQQNFKSNQTSFKNSTQQLFNYDLNNQGNNSQKNYSSFRSFKNSPESNLSNRFSSLSQITQEQKNKDENKEKILQGLKPLFLEMQIIKEAFQNLERLINYKIDASNPNQQDKMNTLYHFAKAKNTFQMLNNQNGLSRCYFNLGVIYILRNEFSLASQYLESSVWLTMALIGIDSLYKIKDKYALQHDTEQEEWLLIFSKRIFSLAYSQKQAAFQIIYQEKEDYLIQNSSLKSFQHKLIPPDQMQQIKSLLKKSLDYFNAIQNLFNNRSQSISEIFQIYIYQEITEILIHLDHKNYCKQIKNYTNKIVQLLSKINRQKFKINQRPISLNDYKLSEESHHIIQEEDIEYLSNSNTNQNDTQIFNQEIINKMIDVINNRQKVILGYLELVQENHFIAIEYLTQSLEEGKFYSPLLRKKTIFYLNQLFEEVSFKQDFIDELILNLDDSVKIDLTLLLQMSSFQYNFIFDNCLQNFVKQNFFRPQDRIQVIIFNENLEEFLPLTIIQSQHHLASIINSIQSYKKQSIQNYMKNASSQLNWQSALIQSLENIQRAQDQKIKYTLIEQKSNNPILQKVECQTKINKFCLDEDDYKMQSSLFSYEPFISENELMIRLKKLREEEVTIYQKEFLSILNHF
ncbi:tetratricopeptide repeat protein (macronuclear) [Tetrahymena thermophila SB210]|uniref:Tetratricopeptide repeat protein n=1 Tax=Tetrahymena thermophila (strain SB210) TaxID=312017 RepID=I7M7U6_TETTS|nr:tetratricopeptide repeat protein [Tetrahymena thermophila SB210]EAR96027.2 tetratricopeptide repeat protein [Tetrahymena thermophila SB210]|eukprot:XP_001016272.2 tetratricopeptide repeat protein [Tetrahymena thermophila SB210]